MNRLAGSNPAPSANFSIKSIYYDRYFWQTIIETIDKRWIVVD